MNTNDSSLVISIYSFGFHVSGIPRDTTGNGGGFVFDCRGLPNPGREPEFQRLTGNDSQIQTYLQGYPEVERFLTHSYELIRESALNYHQRGFNHLMVSFGCTGGQHRSVYCANRIASWLREEGFQIQVVHMDKPDFS